MRDFFTEAFSAVTGSEFDEIPVSIEEFVTSEQYLNMPPLSEYQIEMVKRGTQIYNEETLINWLGAVEGAKRFSETCKEAAFALGKGSGKDMTSTIICAYVAYLLLCLKDPQAYYNKPPGDNIDIMNVAINAQQANRVFFKSLAERIRRSPWFKDKADIKQNEIIFDKNINVISGHSQSESLEGYNVIIVVLDEIDGFTLQTDTGNAKSITAQSTYDMHQASVTSRFPDFGKILLLSFPRSKNGFIMQRYNKMVKEKEVILRSHTFILNPDLPHDQEGNYFTIEWEEDHILEYTMPGYYALKRPTWEVNPIRNIEEFKFNFYSDPIQALQRFACQPGDVDDTTFIKNQAAIDVAFAQQNGVNQYGGFLPGFTPQHGTKYYIHVDLSKVHDRCAVALAHVDRWVVHEMSYHKDVKPFVVVDALRWWQPTKDNPMDYTEVTDYIINLKRRGFDIDLVTFDSWNSVDTMNYIKSQGIKTELLGVKDDLYTDFLVTLYDERIIGPGDDALKEELRQLKYLKDKIDHPRSGFKDLCDAVVGAMYNAVSRTHRNDQADIEIISFSQIKREQRAEREQEQKDQGVIVAPRAPRPVEYEDLSDIVLSQIRLI